MKFPIFWESHKIPWFQTTKQRLFSPNLSKEQDMNIFQQNVSKIFPAKSGFHHHPLCNYWNDSFQYEFPLQFTDFKEMQLKNARPTKMSMSKPWNIVEL
jgi:catechol-2,3-dioxygenase